MTTPVLIVAYYYPPCGGAGTQRFAAFVRHLPSFGYAPTVVTAEPVPSRNAPQLDESLADGFDDHAEVIRVASTPVAWGALRHPARRAGFRMDAEAWVDRALPVARAAARRIGAAAVITTASPYAVARLGAALQRELVVPWILDLRDPWALDGWRRFPTPVHAHWERAAMQRAVAGADAVVANTPEAQRAFIDLAPACRDRITTIPNGFEPDRVPHAAMPSGGPLRIAHVGTLHDPAPRRGIGELNPLARTWRQVCRAERSGRTLIEALGLLRTEAPTLADTLRVELVGQVHPRHAELAEARGVRDLIEAHGYLPHADALAVLRRCHVTYVPLHGIEPGTRALVVPGKLYEALASGRFVLGTLPDGDAADLVRLVDGGAVSPPGEPEALARTLRMLVERHRAGALPRGATGAHLNAFTRRALTARLAQVLDFATGAARTLPAGDPWTETAASRRARDAMLQRAPAARLDRAA